MRPEVGSCRPASEGDIREWWGVKGSLAELEAVMWAVRTTSLARGRCVLGVRSNVIGYAAPTCGSVTPASEARNHECASFFSFPLSVDSFPDVNIPTEVATLVLEQI